MLDDQNQIHKIDKANALGVIAGQLEQLKQTFEIDLPDGPVDQIVVAGMGGSALAADFVRSWLSDRLEIPLVVIRDYVLPAFVDQRTLVVISSYSGNTAETLSAYEDAQRREAQIVILTSGGQLRELAESDDRPLLLLPAGLPPRMAVLGGVKALADLLKALGRVVNAPDQLETAADKVAPAVSDWVSEVDTLRNPAKQLAEKLLGFNLVVYAGPTLAVPGLIWKIGFNENAKNVAFFYPYSEFNHNEFTGWLNPRQKLFKVIEITSDLDNPEIAKRFEISNRLLSGKMPTPLIVEAEGSTKLEQMLWAIMYGDFVSAYLGILNRVDPSSVDLIEKLKKELADE